MTADTITIPCAFSCRNSGILALLLCLVLLTAAPYAAAQDRSMRRVTVPAQMPDGRQTPLPLYAGCHALVVGCSEYETPRAWPRLPNPVKDARDVAQTLTVLGWQVQLVENPTGAALRRELNRLVTDVGRQEDQGILIWFSGHGYTRKEADGSRLGYIVPVDAPDPVKDPGVFMERAVDMRFLEGIARGILSRHVLIHQACSHPRTVPLGSPHCHDLYAHRIPHHPHCCY